MIREAMIERDKKLLQNGDDAPCSTIVPDKNAEAAMSLVKELGPDGALQSIAVAIFDHCSEALPSDEFRMVLFSTLNRHIDSIVEDLVSLGIVGSEDDED